MPAPPRQADKCRPRSPAQGCLNWYQDVPGLRPPGPAFLPPPQPPACKPPGPSRAHLLLPQPRRSVGPVTTAPFLWHLLCAQPMLTKALPAPLTLTQALERDRPPFPSAHWEAFPEPLTCLLPHAGCRDSQGIGQTQQTRLPAPGSSLLTGRKGLIPRQLTC